MKRISFAAIILVAMTFSASAQVTIQRGKTLSELIDNLYGADGIQLGENGHQAHFGQAADFQQFSATLQKSLQSRPIFPIPSAVGIISYKFNEETGTYERVQGSFGPIIAERGTTTGKGNVNVSFASTFSSFETLNGSKRIDLTLRHCQTVDCTFGNPDFPYLKDTISVEMRLKLKSQAYVSSVVYGVSNRLDVGLIVPYIRNDLSIATHASINVHPTNTIPTIHRFDPAVELADQQASGYAQGIGDIVARAKFQLAPNLPFQTAVLADFTFPSGEKEDFLGTGDFRVKTTLIASGSGKRFSPHANAAIEVNTNNTKLSSGEYRLGSEYSASPRLTIVGDLLGVIRQSPEDEFRSNALDGESLIARSEIDGAIGAKYQLSANTLLNVNLLKPLNDRGIRPGLAITIGIQRGL